MALLKSTLLMAFYSVRSGRLFCEQLDYKLYRKGQNHSAHHLSYLGNVLMESRNGLIVDLRIDTANGFAERHGALALLDEHLPNSSGARLGADAGYDTSDFIAALRERTVTPHVAQTRDKRRRSAVDGRTTRHGGYAARRALRRGRLQPAQNRKAPADLSS